MNVESKLVQIRKSREISASELARRVAVSRQTIYAIEAGTYVPNTEVALRLARELQVSVDELFSLKDTPAEAGRLLQAEVLSTVKPPKGQPVRIGQVGARWVSVPVSAVPYYLPEADGVLQTGAGTNLMVFDKGEAAQKRLVVAGCDPATAILARMVERASGVEIVSAGAPSKLALTWVADGKAHIAGSHLEDAKTGEFNLPFLRKQFPGEDFAVVTFARWEEGWVVQSGNPKGVRNAQDLAGKDVRFVNREPGSGSRGLLDRLLTKAGVETARVQGYNRIAPGHLAAAYSVVSGEADVCLATRSAAQCFGLDFVPLHSERYDLVMRRKTADLPAVKAFLDVLQRGELRRKLETLAGYDTAESGRVVA